MSAASPASSNKLIKLIAGVCALGTGMLAAATVISTPAYLLLFLLSGFAVNYLTPLFHQWMSRYWIQKNINSTGGKKDYIDLILKDYTSTLKSTESQKQHHANLSLSHTFFTGLLSLMMSTAIAVGFYFLMALVPSSILLPLTASLIFVPLAIVTFINFDKGITDVWGNIKNYFLNRKANTPPLAKSVHLFLSISILSSIAAAVLTAALTREGVITTIKDLVPILGMVGGPLGWVVFSFMMVSVFSMMAYGIFNLVDGHQLKEKMSLMRSFFKKDAYIKDLNAEWAKHNADIQMKTVDLGKDPSNITTQNELNELYRKKDMVYHRSNMYQRTGFYFLYAGVTAVVFSVCMFGMLMHVVRGTDSFAKMLPKVMGFSHGISTAIATGFMYVAMVAETIFTGTIATSSMNEDVILGQQSAQYQSHLKKQQTWGERIKGYLYRTSQGAHGIFEWLLGFFGASGAHHAKTNLSVLNAQPMHDMSAGGMAARALIERADEPLEGSNCLLWKYDEIGQLKDVDSPKIGRMERLFRKPAAVGP